VPNKYPYAAGYAVYCKPFLNMDKNFGGKSRPRVGETAEEGGGVGGDAPLCRFMVEE
jgi:hypothetical protein